MADVGCAVSDGRLVGFIVVEQGAEFFSKVGIVWLMEEQRLMANHLSQTWDI